MSERAERVVRSTVPLAAVCALALLAVAKGDTVTGDNVQVSFEGQIRPATLPRSKPAPVALRVEGTVRLIEGRRPVPLKRLTIQVNHHASFTVRGLPRCPLRRLRGADTSQALNNCAAALLGYGYVTSHIDVPDQAPFPAFGRVLAFKTIKGGRPAIAIHVFGRTPASTTTVLAAELRRSGPAAGIFGPKITVEMPEVGDDWGYVTAFALTLHRRYSSKGHRLSIVSATCPAPSDLDTVPFKAARGSFELADGQTLTETVGGTCRVAD